MSKFDVTAHGTQMIRVIGCDGGLDVIGCDVGLDGLQMFGCLIAERRSANKFWFVVRTEWRSTLVDDFSVKWWMRILRWSRPEMASVGKAMAWRFFGLMIELSSASWVASSMLECNFGAPGGRVLASPLSEWHAGASKTKNWRRFHQSYSCSMEARLLSIC